MHKPVNKLAVHGGGYVGMTAAVAFAQKGIPVIVYDPDRRTVEGINRGRPRTAEFLTYLNTSVESLVRSGILRATTSFGETEQADVHLIAVPTEHNGQPDDRILLRALNDIADVLPREGLIIIESTITPGTVDRFLSAYPEPPGHAWFLAVCPRRDWFADTEKNLETLPRVVGGVSPACTERAVAVLSLVSRSILPTDYRTAELTKPLENALLHAQIIVAQQLALAYPDRDVRQAVELATTHWRLSPLYLSGGVGGRCVPLGLRYLTCGAVRQSDVLETLVEAEQTFRRAIARAIYDMLYETSRHTVAVLGIAYRPDFRDAGLSPGLDLAHSLFLRGFQVSIHDPMWSAEELRAFGFSVITEKQLRKMHAIILVTPHTLYRDWPERDDLWRRGQLIIDAQGAWQSFAERFRRRGIVYRVLGRPNWSTPIAPLAKRSC